MKRDFAAAIVREDDYGQLVAACSYDLSFPQIFAEWQELVREGTRLAAASGRPTTPVEVDVGEFLRWAALTHVHPCLDALRAFLIVARFGVESGLDTMSGKLPE